MSEDLNMPHFQGKIASSSKRAITAILFTLKGSGLCRLPAIPALFKKWPDVR